MGSSRKKTTGRFTAITISLVALIFSLAAAELAMRAMGYKPLHPRTLIGDGSRPEIPIMTEKHPSLGWVNKPGTYNYPGFSADIESITVTILPDGGRRTMAIDSPLPVTQDKLILVGGSYIQGYAISDQETLAWKLQRRFPDAGVRNLGVPGYGAFQSLLALEDALPNIDGGKTIFYGYIGHHQLRNVLDTGWLEMFTKVGETSYFPPYATIGEDGSLIRHPVSSSNTWPLRNSLALVNKAERAWLQYSSQGRADKHEAVNEKIVVEMQNLAESQEAKFIVLLLLDTDIYTAGFIRFLDANDLDYLNCSPPAFGPEYRVVGEGHPNSKLNSVWEQCITNYLQPGATR
jgi:hypothetical protein